MSSRKRQEENSLNIIIIIIINIINITVVVTIFENCSIIKNVFLAAIDLRYYHYTQKLTTLPAFRKTPSLEEIQGAYFASNSVSSFQSPNFFNNVGLKSSEGHVSNEGITVNEKIPPFWSSPFASTI